jgi:predicted Zn-dependent protease
MNLGTAAARLGQADWAIQAFKVAIEQAPENPYPHRMLAQVYARQKRDKDKAQYHAERARALRAAAGLEGEPKWSA